MEQQVPAQAAFDRLNQAIGVRDQQNKQKSVSKLGRVEDLKLDHHYETDSGGMLAETTATKTAPALGQGARKERGALPARRAVFADETRGATAAPLENRMRIDIFETEIDPFEFSLLDSGHFVLFRKVWRDGQRYIQGALIGQQPFLDGTINTLFAGTVLSQMSDLIVAYRGDVFSVSSGQPSREYLPSSETLNGALLYRAPLSDPFGDVELIYDESERLSRLINNVLQLARLTRNDIQGDFKPVQVSALLDGVLPAIASQIECAGFELNLDCAAGAGNSFVNVDSDYFTQILINLVDNALKFTASTDSKLIDVSCRLLRKATVQISVRDYGPGVPKDQIKKIFKLFYRSESELTRETVGTGIGLALVHQLAANMNGQVDVVNTDPGAEFRVSFPVIPQESC